MERVTHPFNPIYNHNSQVLILGSLPSVKSRELNFYYAHPQNRFWKVIAAITHDNTPTTTEEKIKLLTSHKIAIWDVIESCEIVQSSDSSIKKAIPNNISLVINRSNIRQIFANGKTAKALYDKHVLPITNMECICLPSTSPANAAYSVERLIMSWSQIVNFL